MRRKDFGRTLNLESSYIPIGRRNRPRGTNALTSVTIHNTDNTNAGANARQHAKFLEKVGYHSGGIWVSWHYTVDDKRVVKHLPIDEQSYHAHADANASSAAIEICMYSGIDQEAAFDRAARLVAVLLYDIKSLGRTTDNVFPHQHWTGKRCPRLLLNSAGKPGTKWKNFLSKAQDYFESID